MNFARFEDFPRRSHDVFLNDPKHQTPFTFLIGWHLTLLLREPAHAGPLGVLGVINGQVIKDLVLAGVFGEALSLTKWDERFNYLVGMAWAAFDTWAKAHNKKHNVKLWTRWRLSLTTMKSFPKLKCKAHDALVVLEWVAHMSNKHVVDCGDLPQEYGELRAWLCWSWHRFFWVCRTCGAEFSDAETSELRSLKPYMFTAWNRILQVAIDGGVPAWKMLPKLHVMCP